MKIDVSNIKLNLKKNGYFYIKNFFSNNKSFKKTQNEITSFLNYFFGKNYNAIEHFNPIIIQKFRKNKKISKFLNDKINLLPSLQNLLSDDASIKLIKQVLNSKKSPLVSNNHRLRVQIPGNDKLSNLPWHYDEQYNKFKNASSIVMWISLTDINNLMGPILFKVGSHKLKKRKSIKFRKSATAIVPSVKISNKLKNMREHSFETKKGDIVLIDFKTIHRSGFNLSNTNVKWSAQARFHALE